ncbi:hypothetical protein [Enterococcus hirae]|nr:hypothetical protein [Enterococcus hirae]
MIDQGNEENEKGSVWIGSMKGPFGRCLPLIFRFFNYLKEF